MFGVRTKLLGLIGNNISYTLSPAIHNYSFSKLGIDAVYLVFDIKPDDLETVINGLTKVAYGFNVTIPYKERVAELIQCEDECRELGAVNTVVNGRGYNTDYRALIKIFNGLELDLHDSGCLVFGAGGAAAAATLSLGKLGCKVMLMDRTPRRAMELSKRLSSLGIDASFIASCGDHQVKVVVNATPKPDLVPPECVRGKLAVEFVYSPLLTPFLRTAISRGMKVIDGLSILINQALEAQKIWFGKSLSPEEVRMFLYDGQFIR